LLLKNFLQFKLLKRFLNFRFSGDDPRFDVLTGKTASDVAIDAQNDKPTLNGDSSTENGIVDGSLETSATKATKVVDHSDNQSGDELKVVVATEAKENQN
jgi:hypothetical protein